MDVHIHIHSKTPDLWHNPCVVGGGAGRVSVSQCQPGGQKQWGQQSSGGANQSPQPRGAAGGGGGGRQWKWVCIDRRFIVARFYYHLIFPSSTFDQESFLDISSWLWCMF